jgi:hypothetical protein
MPRELPTEELLRYIAHAGQYCPWCGEPAVLLDEIERDGEFLFRNCSCEQCDNSWTEYLEVIEVCMHHSAKDSKNYPVSVTESSA